MPDYKPLGIDDPMPFGKHRGVLMSEIAAEEPWYIAWLVKQDVNLTQELIDFAADQTKGKKGKCRR